MIELIQKFRLYLDYLEEHYLNVQKAWKLINEKCSNDFRFMHDDYVWNSIDNEVRNHDLSKLSMSEFTQYRQKFFPCENEVIDKSAFTLAWEHHKSNNSHHWQNWTVKEQDDQYADMFLVMNVIDWIAMSMKFGDTAKSYYEKHKSEIKLPEWSIKLMYEIFDCIYE